MEQTCPTAGVEDGSLAPRRLSDALERAGGDTHPVQGNSDVPMQDPDSRLAAELSRIRQEFATDDPPLTRPADPHTPGFGKGSPPRQRLTFSP